MDRDLAYAGYAILLENHLQASKDRLQQGLGERERERELVVGILRDCRAIDVFVPPACLDYLLELSS